MSQSITEDRLLKLSVGIKFEVKTFEPTMQTVVGAIAVMTALHSIPGWSLETIAIPLYVGSIAAAIAIGFGLAVTAKRLKRTWLPTTVAATASAFRFVTDAAIIEAGVIAALVLLSLIGMAVMKGVTAPTAEAPGALSMTGSPAAAPAKAL
ncbi:hypothetical protein [Rhodococcus sp. NBC_00294]|uniref:hypothetical protein n=1 Tax=Rhodococcus sp. NBC_00294 TaxID=2976004 RepID=UPI002E287B3E|nr:hypothetical protein [Rhodococcus sp. NBC_00294]